jgi:hypothetical protein
LKSSAVSSLKMKMNPSPMKPNVSTLPRGSTDRMNRYDKAPGHLEASSWRSHAEDARQSALPRDSKIHTVPRNIGERVWARFRGHP